MQRKWNLAISLSLLLLGTSCIEKVTITAQPSPAPEPDAIPVVVQTPPAETDARIQQLFSERKIYYLQQLKLNFENPNSASTTVLYSIQGELQNVLWYASVYRQTEILEGLSEIALLAYSYLTETDQKIFHSAVLADGSQPYTSLHPLGKKYKMWLTPKPFVDSTGAAYNIGLETVLDAAQFDFLAARLVHSIVSLPSESQSPKMLEVVQKYAPFLLQDQYERWIFRTPGVPGGWQVRGWGCNDGTFSHEEHLSHILARHYGTSHFSPFLFRSYCNALLDKDLWIITGVIELLEANTKNPVLVPVDPVLKAKLVSYLQLGARVVRSRISEHQVKNFLGQTVTAQNLDLGAFDEHPDMKYTGYTTPEFPGWTDAANKAAAKPPIGSVNIGSDLSHARRWVHQFESMLAVSAKYGLEFPSREDLEKQANQFAYVVFNGNFEAPQFKNFMNGTNGWYRVNYSNRPGYGYAPFAMTAHALPSGYAFWAKYNPDIKRILDAKFAHEPPTSSAHLISSLPSLAMPLGFY